MRGWGREENEKEDKAVAEGHAGADKICLSLASGCVCRGGGSGCLAQTRAEWHGQRGFCLANRAGDGRRESWGLWLSGWGWPSWKSCGPWCGWRIWQAWTGTATEVASVEPSSHRGQRKKALLSVEDEGTVSVEQSLIYTQVNTFTHAFRFIWTCFQFFLSHILSHSRQHSPHRHRQPLSWKIKFHAFRPRQFILKKEDSKEERD